MLAKLIIFIADLMLASAIFIILYAVYFIAATGIFILVLLYIFKVEMEKTCDINKGRIWVLDSSSHASGKLFVGNLEKVHFRRVPVHFPASREGAFLPKESGYLF